MRSLILSLLLVTLVTGCSALEDMASVTEKQALVQKAIKDKYGWETMVGWNMHNGTLTQVTVIFNADQVRGETIASVEQAAQSGVASAFQSKPQVIYVQVASEPSS
jgi:hypothetical protein